MKKKNGILALVMDFRSSVKIQFTEVDKKQIFNGINLEQYENYVIRECWNDYVKEENLKWAKKNKYDVLFYEFWPLL
jgi:hypothetical protein